MAVATFSKVRDEAERDFSQALEKHIQSSIETLLARKEKNQLSRAMGEHTEYATRQESNS